MLRNLRSRRRPPYGAYICAFISALLLLLSVSLLYSRLSLSHPQSHPYSRPFHQLDSDSLVSDSSDEAVNGGDDRIDELDIVEEQQQEDAELDEEDGGFDQIKSSGYFFDHVSGSIRRAFNKRSIEEWDDDRFGFIVGSGMEDPSKAAFGSDDTPVDENVRRKATQVMGIEDALLLKMGRKGSPLREGWGDWFEKKAVFLRKDRMFRSTWDLLNPMNNPILQDPDAVGVTGFTRGDRLLQKWLMNEFKRVPFIGRKTLDITGGSKLQKNCTSGAGNDCNSKKDKLGSFVSDKDSSSEIRLRTSNGNVGNADTNSGTQKYSDRVEHGKSVVHFGEVDDLSGSKDVMNSRIQRKPESLNHIYADGKRWGYYPGLPPHLTFTNFMDAFFRMGKCRMRVYMVWNSPPWMYSVRHQRGLESLLLHHKDACVVVFSETIELDFFKDKFLNDGYKIAVVMPNLDELLKDTPTHIFSSVWSEWRKTKFYSTHYSELVRLAALNKYGGIYMDSDIVVLKPISLLNNSVGMENQEDGGVLNGAVMAFERNSPFIKECLKEFYETYDDGRLRWNGADLLTRVGRKFWGPKDSFAKQMELKVETPQVFFPISSESITRYFTAPATETEKAQEDVLFEIILRDSLTFHFWNSLTSALIPEPDSLAFRLINYPCIRCLELL